MTAARRHGNRRRLLSNGLLASRPLMSRLLLNGPLLRFLTLLLNGLLPLLGYLLNSPLIGDLRARSFPGCAAGDLPLLRGLRIAAHGRLAIGVFPRGLHDGFGLMVRTRND